MNINGPNYSPSLAQMETGDRVGLSVLKKSMDIQAESAMALIAAVPAAPEAARAPDPTARVGGTLDVIA